MNRSSFSRPSFTILGYLSVPLSQYSSRAPQILARRNVSPVRILGRPPEARGLLLSLIYSVSSWYGGGQQYNHQQASSHPFLWSLFLISSFQVLLKMADDERRTSKRSRFDQTESDVRRSSRFDRDSRSPVSRHAYTRQRSRSPIAPKSTSTTNEEKRSPAVDPAAAAGKEYTCKIGTINSQG